MWHDRPALVAAAVATTVLDRGALHLGAALVAARGRGGAGARRPAPVAPLEARPARGACTGGNALAATHDARALLPLILEVVTEATGARGGLLVQDGEEIGWFGEVGEKEPLELDLTGDDEAGGRTTLLLYPPRRGFGKEAAALAEWLATQAGIALENARLHERVQRQATTDELTGLVNRRRFLEALENELERSRLFETPLSLVLADLALQGRQRRARPSRGRPGAADVRRPLAGPRAEGRRRRAARGRGVRRPLARDVRRLRGARRRPDAPRARASRRSRWAGEPDLADGELRHRAARARPASEQLLSRADAALYDAKSAGKNRVSLAPAALGG